MALAATIVAATSPDRGDRTHSMVGMKPEDFADLVHLRRARDLMDRHYQEPVDVPAMTGPPSPIS